MSTTGIVRRIDDLGRVVIPKEIRKTLRIKEGEALEIEVTNDNIVLKKYSSLSDIESFLSIFIEEVNKILCKNILFFDTDKIIGGSSGVKKEYVDHNISDYISNLLSNRKVGHEDINAELEIIKDKFISCNYLFSSIVPNGDIVGGILIFSDEDINQDDRLFLNLIIETLTKYIEE